MRNEQDSLVILHHDEVFATREEALNYIINEYEPKSLDAEPFVVKYGDTTKPNIILAFGTSSTGRGSFYAIDAAKIEERIEEISHEQGGIEEITDNINSIVSASGLTYDENKIRNKITYEPNRRDIIIGDAESIADAISLLSEYVQQNFSNTDFTLGESEAIKLLFVQQPNNKMSLVAEIKISKHGESDDLDFNNNIIGVKADGLYAASHLAYDEARNQLIFTTSGYRDGNFQDDAVVQRIDLGQSETKQLIIDNKANSPIILEKTTTDEGDVLSADVSILSNPNNLLVIKNGSLFVDSDSNSHLALFGEQVTNVQSAINLLKDRTDNLEELRETVAELEEDNENIKVVLQGYQTDLEHQKQRITNNENNISQLTTDEHNLEIEVAVLKERVNNLEGRVTEAYDRATLALSKIEEMGDISGLISRIEHIEEVLRNLIDFGYYETH